MGDISWFKQVWATGPTYVNDRAVFLVLVDVMREESRRAWPAVATIAQRTGLSDRRVRDRLRALEADGWITTAELGGGRHRTTTYVVHVERLSTGARNPDETRTKKPGRNPDVVTRNPDATSLNPDATSAHRLEVLRKGLDARDAAVADVPMPGVLTDAPLPCQRHPNGWHHKEPCGRCASLREYDEQQRAAAPATRARHDDEYCGECDHGWIGRDVVTPCPNRCLDPVRLTDAEVDLAASAPTTRDNAADEVAPRRERRTNNNDGPAPLDVAAMFANASSPPARDPRFGEAWERKAVTPR